VDGDEDSAKEPYDAGLLSEKGWKKVVDYQWVV